MNISKLIKWSKRMMAMMQIQLVNKKWNDSKWLELNAMLRRTQINNVSISKEFIYMYFVNKLTKKNKF